MQYSKKVNIIQEDGDGLLHGTKLLLGLVEQLDNTDRIFCGVSYFVLVGAADTLKKIGM